MRHFVISIMQPVPVLVTPKDLPRVAAVVALGLALSSWLALQLDAIYTAEDQPAEDINPDFYYPCAKAFIDLFIAVRLTPLDDLHRAVGYFLSAYFTAMVVSRYFGHGAYDLLPPNGSWSN